MIGGEFWSAIFAFGETVRVPVSGGIEGIFGGVFFVVESAREIEQAWGDVGVADEGAVANPAFGVVGISDDEGYAQSGLADSGFGAWEGHAVVGSDHDQRFVVEVVFFKDLDETTEAGVESGDALVILGELGAGRGGIGKEGRNDDVLGAINGLTDAGVRLVVG